MDNVAVSVLKTRCSDPMEFRVNTSSNANRDAHIITLTNAHHARLAGAAVDPEKLVEASFRFLLDRVPPENIAERFDLPAIQQYFPDFELELPTYLAAVANKSVDVAKKKEGRPEPPLQGMAQRAN